MLSNKSLFIQSLRENTKFLKTGKLLLIIWLLLVIPFIIHIQPTSGATIRVPTQYARIKDAVNAAVTGDTIQVDPGIYYENDIFIDVTITALTIIGANPQTTIIDGMGNGTIFSIDGTNVQITGFTIRNPGNNNNAIASEKPGPSASNDFHRFTNNIITTSAYGISLSLSNRNTIFNNTFTDNPFGAITLSNSATNNITGNIIKDSAYGIRIFNSATNTIASNQITLTSYSIHISGATSTGVAIRNNVFAGRTAGVYSSSGTTTIERNTIIDGSAAIYLQGTSATVNYNKVLNSSYGIRLYYSSATTSSHNIRNNKITDSDWAIELTNSNGNTFQANWLQDNTYGLFMSFSSSNLFYRNNFVNNALQAYAGTGSNTWSSGGQGNYWSDYTGIDANGNGIGDTPYLISPIGQDSSPLMDTWSEHDVAIESVNTDATQAYVGTIINITVMVKNKGRIGAAETFTVTAKYNTTAIQTRTVTNLAAGSNQNLTFNWNTAQLNRGNYTISAEASLVTDELNSDNNKRNDGAVRLRESLAGDINHDDTVNNLDLSLLTQAFGATPQSGNWNPDADLNTDNIIDAEDLRILGENYGRTA
ncbi:MAG TPA: NosD domain-containing protein [Candidatus Bathyarchaeia archaeon]|nr:NosD domain-containing protein [Candidatus Bathyarchaeia archaeon]